MRLVPLSSLREGSELAKTIFDPEGRILLAKGVIIKSNIIKRIRAAGIMSVYINDEYSDTEIEDIIKPELRQKVVKTIKDSFNKFFGFTSSNGKINKNVSKQIDQNMMNINFLVSSIVDEIYSQKDILIKIVDIKTLDNYIYEHCVSVAILSIIMGIELKFNKDKLTHLAFGAILHDLGKTYVPKEILLKKGKLDDNEYDIIKNHSKQGYEYLKDNMYVSSIPRVITLQHHERVDGTGYPNGLKGDEINDCAKIVAIADVYDALTSDRPYRAAMSPNEALEYIMGASGTLFDYEMVRAFVRRVVPYPEGTLVKLSNGDVGVVEETNAKFTLRPKIKLIMHNGAEVNNMYFDLIDEKNINITIKDVAYNIDD